MNKLSYYDVLGHLIPGLVFLAGLGLISTHVGDKIPKIPGGEGVKVMFVTAGAYYIGHLLSAVGSLIQPILYFFWGGKPSRRILIANTPHFHSEMRDNVRKNLAKKCNLPEKIPNAYRKRAEYLDALFGYAQSFCDKEHLGRIAEFNAAYALHRSLFMASFLAGVISLYWISRVSIPIESNLVTLLIAGYFLAAGISFCRARQRAYYFVREVLRMYHLQEK